MTDIQELLNHLIQNSKLDRDRSEKSLIEKYLNKNDIEFICGWITDNIRKSTNINECLGYMTGFKIVMKFKTLVNTEFVDDLSGLFLELQEHEEFRVRLLAGECMGLVCSVMGLEKYKLYLVSVKNGILSNIEERKEKPPSNLIDKLSNNKEIFHDTAGWKALETWMKCFLSIIQGIGDEFANVIDEEIFDVVSQGMNHTNRFVRETGYQLITTIVTNKGCSSNEHIFLKISKQLKMGLCDNWSQVRYAASIAVRALFENCKEMILKHQDEVYKLLLGPMCLNRHYLAEGVRIYNQTTWNQIFETKGIDYVTMYLSEVVDFFIDQFNADNHAVREAACSSIEEIVNSKMKRELIEQHFERFYQALLDGFDDDSWPVRDKACVAVAHVCRLFPEKCDKNNGYNMKTELFPLLIANIMDSIPSVREGASKVVAQLIGSLPDDVAQSYIQESLKLITDKLEGVKDQKADSKSASTLNRNEPGLFGVIQGTIRSPRSKSDELKDEDYEAQFTDQQMYSCGSLAPKMYKGKLRKSGGGCHDGKFQRESEPWEKADGCTLFAGYLCLEVPSSRKQISEIIPQIVETCRLKHYTHWCNFMATVARIIPNLYNGLGKVEFKKYLSILLPILEDAYESEVPLTRVASLETLTLLCYKLGPNILRGRIEMHCSAKFVDSMDTELAFQKN